MKISVAQTAEPTLTPALKVKLRRELRLYLELKKLVEETQEEMNTLKAEVDAVRREAGLEVLNFEGFVQYATTGGTSKRLDRKKLIAQGVTPAMLEMATTEKPKKDSVTLRCPGEKSHESEE
jgi:hypothetical protein